jgi:hypothetical protein
MNIAISLTFLTLVCTLVSYGILEIIRNTDIGNKGRENIVLPTGIKKYHKEFKFKTV